MPNTFLIIALSPIDNLIHISSLVFSFYKTQESHIPNDFSITWLLVLIFRRNATSLWLNISGKTRTREKYRTVYNERQKLQLEEQYVANTYISAEQKADIARDIGLSERQVKIWFQNRRAKDRRHKYRQSAAQHH